MRRALIAIVILAIPNLTWAGKYLDGNELYQQLLRRPKTSADPVTTDDLIYSRMAVGYVLGVIDSFENCIPQQVTRGQLADTTIQYLEAHPEQRHLVAASLVKVAVAEKFPCQKAK